VIKRPLIQCLFAASVVSLFALSPLEAQATRTWVSGVGDDANPCSRTAPCKTFAGAISKTATAGEINVLDPGGFGGVTITKSITISSESFEAGVLVSGTNAIVVNAPSTATIVLRGLDIEGLGTGINGINFLAGGVLHVENCTINNFANTGINFAPSTVAQLYLKNVIVRGTNSPTTLAGIRFAPTGAGSATSSLEDVRILRMTNGLVLETASKVVARNVISSKNGLHGYFAKVGTELNLDRSESSNNGGSGIRANGGATTIVRVANTVVTGNALGIDPAGGALIKSYGNNQVSGNTTDGAFTLPNLPQL
jgi:hypothetical protein